MNLVVTGLIGSGKSTVARYISEKYNFEFIEVDKIAAKIMVRDEELNWLEKKFSDVVYKKGNDRFIDKYILRQKIFNSYKYNSILRKHLWPIVKSELFKIIDNDKTKNYVIELLTSKSFCWDKRFDNFIVLKSDNNFLTRRVVARDLRPLSETESIISIQKRIMIDKNLKRRHKAIFVNNETTIDNLYKEIDQAMKLILKNNG